METKYKKYYNELIEKAQKRSLKNSYFETHHIIPRCLGGSNDKDNLVDLTAREHYVAHLLLVKIYPNEYGLVKAANMMSTFSEFNNERIKNRRYSWLKEKFSLAMSVAQQGENNSQYGTIWICKVDEQINKKIKSTELEYYISLGFIKGRNVWLKKTKEDINNNRCKLKNSKLSSEDLIKKETKQKIFNDKIKNVDNIYNDFVKFGYDFVMNKYGFNNKPNLSQFLKRHCKEYKPQNGKKRG